VPEASRPRVHLLRIGEGALDRRLLDLVLLHRTQGDDRLDLPEDRPLALDAARPVHDGVPPIGVGDDALLVGALDHREHVALCDPAPEVRLDPVEEFLPGDPRLGIEDGLPLLRGHLRHVVGRELLEVVRRLDLAAERLDCIVLAGLPGDSVGALVVPRSVAHRSGLGRRSP
jgi:hypothetical protein